jgi:hypothetical protein
MERQRPPHHGSWFADMLELLSPDPEKARVTGTPAEMTVSAAREAFLVSSAASLPPGPAGMLTLVPEFVAVTRIQVNLVYRIAKYYGREGSVDRVTLLLVFGQAFGIGAGRIALREAEKRLVVRLLQERAGRTLLERLGARVGRRMALAGLGRWIPLVSAPVFGLIARSLTRKIGAHAQKHFSCPLPS